MFFNILYLSDWAEVTKNLNFFQALEYVHSTLRFGSVLGVGNILALLDMLGNPQDKLKVVHVAGTNGKGSICVYISEILRNSNAKVGIYLSPYVNDFNERIQINRVNIANEDLAKYVTIVKENVDKMVVDGKRPTEFEIITAVAFLYFYDKNCDFVVIEVGLGGNFDATNVFKTLIVSVIASISRDHMKQLGESLSEIAYAKCGIIKDSCPAVTYPIQAKEVFDVIKSTVSRTNSPLIIPNLHSLSIKKMNISGTEFHYKQLALKIKMLGSHQINNAITALEAISVMRQAGFNISNSDIYSGLRRASLNGRFEIINKNPLVIIDGCHNHSAILVFKNALKFYIPNKKVITIMGIFADKEYEKCIEEIAKISNIFIAFTTNDSRALSGFDIARVAKKFTQDVHIANDRDSAIKYAKARASSDSVICMCGSFTVISNVREKFHQSEL